MYVHTVLIVLFVTLPRCPRRVRAEAERRHPKIPDDLLELHPWLKDHFKGNDRGATGKVGAATSHGGGDASSSGGVAEPPKAVEITDDDVEIVWHDLAEKRLEFEAMEEDNEDMSFYTLVRGGLGTKRKKGDAFDCVATYIRGKVPQLFAKHYKLGQMYSFSLKDTLYGEYGAGVMAREVCRRCEFFYRQYLDSEEDDEDFKFTEEMISAYVESMEFLDWACSLDISTASFERMLTVRLITPTNPSKPGSSTD
jgi:hypothetical protein